MRVSKIATRIAVDAATGCHNWTGAKGTAGYGSAQVGKKAVVAHRWFFEQARGPIPHGMVLDHLCRNLICCNPDHLEPVTHKENVLRGVSFAAQNAVKTECVHGHAFSPENTYRRRDGTRDCRACGRARTRRYKQRKVA